MIHIRAFEEYDGNQEKHGAKGFRDGVYAMVFSSLIITSTILFTCEAFFKKENQNIYLDSFLL